MHIGQKTQKGNILEISNKEIAKAIHKSPSAVSYLKRRNNDEFKLLTFAVKGKKLGLCDEDLIIIKKIKDAWGDK